MTASGAAGDLGDLGGIPRLVLDDDGLDRLELAQGGWLPPSTLPGAVTSGTGLLLTDRENSPLALLEASDGAGPTLRVLRALSRGSGPHWDPAARMSLADLRARTAGASSGVLACVIDDVPTRVDEDVLVSTARAAREDAIVVIVPVARRPLPPGRVGAAGLTRVAWAVADGLAADRPERTVIRLVLPWPTDGLADLGRVLGAAGVGPSARVTDLRSADELGRVSALPDMLEREVGDLYPPASAREVLRAHRSAPERGAVVFLTGLSGSGKSTIARALADELADEDPRRVTLLDGDEVRHHLSRGLGFDAESRAANIDRIAWVASLIAAHGGIAVAAPIAPFGDGRRAARRMAEEHGAFLLVYVSTPLEVCEARDRKGLYARARAGEIEEFTGISSPYEVPEDADLIVDTTSLDVADAVGQVRDALEAKLAGG
jgi:sulfate adenylyltransferase